ncbi:MAG: magnesium transporter [Alphaproteobacteria bacterium]|nr:magnesium transporter [Alphaproteobacteria bacterium]
MAAESPRAWITLRSLAETGTSEELGRYARSLASDELLHAMFRLNRDEQTRLLTRLPPKMAASMLGDVPNELAAEILDDLAPQDGAAVLNEMDSDSQADILGSMEREEAEQFLSLMSPTEAEHARLLLAYEADVAGGLMITEFLAFPEATTIEQITAELKRVAHLDEGYHIDQIYALSPDGLLAGAVPLIEMVGAGGSTRLADLMSAVRPTKADAELHDLAAFFDHDRSPSIPVVDDRRHLVGVVTREAVDHAKAMQSEEMQRKIQGIVGGDEIRTAPTLKRSARRLVWLSINIVLNGIAASVIAFYQGTLSAVIALAVFLPIVSDMSGCSGNQAVAVSLRELSLGFIRPFDVLRVWGKELSVGLLNGIVLGCLLGAVAWIWKGNPYLGVVVGGALAANTVVAVSIGGSVPLILKRLGLDPALASGPILTTVTDMCGFLFVLSFATAALPQLAP